MIYNDLYIINKRVAELPRVLMVKRNPTSSKTEGLSWQFPNLARKIDAEETAELRAQRLEKRFGIQVDNIQSLGLSRSYSEDPTINSTYFSADYRAGEVQLDTDKYTDFEWSLAKEVISHFTTSWHWVIKSYLDSL